MTVSSACTKLMSTSRHVGSAVAQLVTAASANDDQQHIGASAVELAQVRPGLTEFLPKTEQILYRKSIIFYRKIMMRHFSLKMTIFKIPESPRFHRRNPRCTFRALRRQHRPSRGVCSIRCSRLRPGLRQGQRESAGDPVE